MRFARRCSKAMRQGKASVCLLGLMLGTTGLLGGCEDPPQPVTTPEPAQHGNEQPQTTPPEPAGEPPPPSVDFAARVLHYDYGFDLRPTGDTPHPAHSRLYLQVPASGGDCTVLKGPPGITQVKWNGADATRVEALTGAWRVCGPTLPNQLLVIEADISVPVATYDYTQVGFSQRRDRKGQLASYLMSWVEQCDRLGLCDDAPGQLATFSFQVEHNAGDVVLCPGTRLSVSATQTRCASLLQQAPTYSAFAIASNPSWVRSTFAEAGPYRLEFFEGPGGLLAPALDAAVFADYLAWITGLLGPLPYGDTLRVGGAPTEFLGMEHPGNIILSEDLPLLRSEYANQTRHTLMHEIAHQWAGNRTTLAEAHDFAWKEAIAEYLAYVYEARHWPQDAAKTRAYWDRMARSAMFYPRPEDHPAPFLTFAADVYGTGPMLLFLQLEELLPGGQEDVLRGIQHFLAAPGARSTQHLHESLEQGAHLAPGSLDVYFDAWIHGTNEPDWPYFDVEPAQDEETGQLTLSVTQQTYEGGIYPVKVKVRVQGATQTQDIVVDYGLAPTSATLVTPPVSFPEPVVQWTVDPESRVVNRRFFGALREAAPPRWHF
ncbi:M1 family metallopeptidase [Cystobacter fuscus]|nr:M1 family metallopeptidase [Cystobacter fuscus]